MMEHRRTIQNNTNNLFYSISGEGEPIIMVHGNFTDHRIWDYQIESLAEKYQVIRYDLRGYGRSHVPTSPFSNVDDLYFLIQELNLKKVSLIGSSMGGSVVIDFTLKYPEYVKSLILVAPSLNGYRYPLKLTLECIKNVFVMNSKGREAAIHRMVTHSFWKYFFPAEDLSEARLKLLEVLSSPKNYFSFDPKLMMVLKPYASKRLSEITAPALIISAENDSYFNIKAGNYIHSKIARSKLIQMKDCGHLPFLEKPIEFNCAVLNFLEGVNGV